MAPETVTQSDVFLRQAAACEGRSPLYAELCRRFATDPNVAAILESPPHWDAPLRLLSGLHSLVLTGEASWDSVDVALVEHQGFLRHCVAERAVQTNETQRCWMLLPCFLEVIRRAEPTSIDLIELGPSAGLNLVWDRYRYRYEAGTWGASDAPLELHGEERRPIPAELLQVSPEIGSRVGIDINPIDLTDDESALLLKSFVWADQTWRLPQLDAAIASLREDPPELLRADLADELPKLLSARRPDSLTIVWQTAALIYLTDERQQVVREALAEAGRGRPLAFVETATPRDGSETYYGLSMQLWPGGEPVELALADFHGAWIDWHS